MFPARFPLRCRADLFQAAPRSREAVSGIFVQLGTFPMGYARRITIVHRSSTYGAPSAAVRLWRYHNGLYMDRVDGLPWAAVVVANRPQRNSGNVLVASRGLRVSCTEATGMLVSLRADRTRRSTLMACRIVKDFVLTPNAFACAVVCAVAFAMRRRVPQLLAQALCRPCVNPRIHGLSVSAPCSASLLVVMLVLVRLPPPRNALVMSTWFLA